MARKPIGINLDDNDMNNANDNFIELYAGLGTATGTKKILDDFLNGSSVVTRIMMSNNSVGASEIIDGSINQFKLADNSISEVKLRDASVGRDKVKDSAITNSKLSTNAVGNQNIIDASIGGEKLQDLTIGTEKIQNYSVSNGKMTNKAITRGKLDDSFMFNGRLSSNVNINSVLDDGVYIVEMNNEGTYPEGMAKNRVYALDVKRVQGWVHQTLSGLESPENCFIRWLGASSGTIGEWKRYAGQSDADSKLTPLKILMVGNSFAHNVSEEAIKILARTGIDATISVVYKPSESLEGLHENTITNAKIYSYYERTSLNGSFNTIKKDDYSLLDCLSEHDDWNIITFQQRSVFSPDYSTYQPYLNELISYAKSSVPNSFEVGILQTWADATSRTPNQIEMYNGLVDAYDRAMMDEDIGIILPVGTAIQNARSNDALNSVGDELTEDGYHLGTLGKQIAGFTLFESLFSGRYKKDLFNDVHSVPGSVTNYQNYYAKLAARNAVLKPNKLSEL